MKKIIGLVILLASLNACMVGPKYSRPETSSPEAWMGVNEFVNAPDSVGNLKWFNIFNDSTLKSLIDTALKYNYNLQSASSRIEQARAAYGINKADLLPSFGYSALGELNSPGDDNFNVVATASWEIDFWGKLRHAKRASYATMLASEEGLKTIKTTLISDVCTYYFTMRDLDNRMVIAQKTIESRTAYFNLINARFIGGHVSELDMLQADQQLQIAKATLNSTKRQLNATERSLNILLGQRPQPIARGLENINIQVVEKIPAGLPSSLLDQRPDVKQAEFELMASTERIGVAQAMRFPSVSLTGFFGLASVELSSLLTDASLIGNATAGIIGPIFAWGANKRRVDIVRSQASINANQYIATYFNALGEVENALVNIETSTGEFEARQKQAQSALKALTLSQQRYNSGYTDYLEVLVAENAMLESQIQASSTRAQQLSAYIYLYRALGGGW